MTVERLTYFENEQTETKIKVHPLCKWPHFVAIRPWCRPRCTCCVTTPGPASTSVTRSTPSCRSPGSGTTLGETNQLHGRINISFAIKRALLYEIYLMSDTMNTKSIHLCCVYIAILPYDFTRYSLAFVSKASILNSPLSPLHSHRPASSRRR